MSVPAGQDFALLTSNIVAALYDTLQKGQQFYVMPAAGKWLFFHNGPTQIH